MNRLCLLNRNWQKPPKKWHFEHVEWPEGNKCWPKVNKSWLFEKFISCTATFVFISSEYLQNTRIYFQVNINIGFLKKMTPRTLQNVHFMLFSLLFLKLKFYSKPVFAIKLPLELYQRVLLQKLRFKVRFTSKMTELFEFHNERAPQCTPARQKTAFGSTSKSKKSIFDHF